MTKLTISSKYKDQNCILALKKIGHTLSVSFFLQFYFNSKIHLSKLPEASTTCTQPNSSIRGQQLILHSCLRLSYIANCNWINQFLFFLSTNTHSHQIIVKISVKLVVIVKFFLLFSFISPRDQELQKYSHVLAFICG